MTQRIADNYLTDIGFDVLKDNVNIFYKDTGDFYNQVFLDENFKNPQWRELNHQEIDWFEDTWNSISDDNELQDEGTAFHPKFFTQGKQYEAYKIIRDLFKNANKELFIVDPYVHSDMFDTLEIVPGNIPIQILTEKLQGEAKIIAKKFSQQRGNVTIRTAKAFHDRYVFVDGKCYMFGSSLNNFGGKATTFYPIPQDYIVGAIRNYIDSIWTNECSDPFAK